MENNYKLTKDELFYIEILKEQEKFENENWDEIQISLKEIDEIERNEQLKIDLEKYNLHTTKNFYILQQIATEKIVNEDTRFFRKERLNKIEDYKKLFIKEGLKNCKNKEDLVILLNKFYLKVQEIREEEIECRDIKNVPWMWEDEKSRKKVHKELPFPCWKSEKYIENEKEEIKEDKKVYLSYKEKLLDNPQNLKEIKNVLENNNKILMQAGTGTGKTYTISKLFNTYYKYTEDNQFLNILVVPTRSQSLQLESDPNYNFKTIVGGSKDILLTNWEEERIIKDFILGIKTKEFLTDLKECNNYVVVIDKIDTLLPIIEEYGNNMYINLVLDECHKLYTDYNFRSGAILKLRKVMNEIQKLNLSRIFMMSATITSVKEFETDIDKEVYFTTSNKTCKNKEFEIVYCKNKNEKFDTKLNSIILNEVESGNKVFCRINSRESIKNCSSILRNKGKNVLEVCSQDKNFIIDKISNTKEIEHELYTQGDTYEFDGYKFDVEIVKEILEEIKENTIYDNNIYNCFVNNSTLPDSDIWFTTSLLDEGGSIKEIEEIGQTENITCIFVIKNKLHMQLDNIIQFAARIRFPYKKFIVLFADFKEEEEEKKEASISFYKENLLKETKMTKNMVKEYINLLLFRENTPEDIKKNLEEEYFKMNKIDNNGIGNNCFKITTDIYKDKNFELVTVFGRYYLYVDYYSIDYTSYSRYNRQFYNKTSLFSNKMKKYFGCKEVKKNEFDIRKDIENDIHVNLFTKLKESVDQRKIFFDLEFKNELDDFDDIDGIIDTTNVRKLRELIHIRKLSSHSNKSEDIVLDCINVIESNKCNKFKEDNLVRIINKLDIDKIINLLKGTITKSDEELFIILKKYKIMEIFNRIYKLVDKDKTLLENSIKKAAGHKDKLNEIIIELENKKLNNLFLTDIELLNIYGIAGQEHKIILEHIYKTDSTGKMKEVSITEEKLEEIIIDLNTYFNKGEENRTYTKGKIKNKIKKMGSTTKKNNLILKYLYV